MLTPEDRLVSKHSASKREEHDFFNDDSVGVNEHIRLTRKLKESKTIIKHKFYHWKFLLAIVMIFLLSFIVVYYHMFLFDIRDTILYYFAIFFTVIATPFAIVEPIMLLRNREVLKHKYHDPKPGRKLLVVITTNGNAVAIVNKIIAILRSYNIEMAIRAVTDPHHNVIPFDR